MIPEAPTGMYEDGDDWHPNTPDVESCWANVPESPAWSWQAAMAASDFWWAWHRAWHGIRHRREIALHEACVQAKAELGIGDSSDLALMLRAYQL